MNVWKFRLTAIVSHPTQVPTFFEFGPSNTFAIISFLDSWLTGSYLDSYWFNSVSNELQIINDVILTHQFRSLLHCIPKRPLQSQSNRRCATPIWDCSDSDIRTWCSPTFFRVYRPQRIQWNWINMVFCPTDDWPEYVYTCLYYFPPPADYAVSMLPWNFSFSPCPRVLLLSNRCSDEIKICCDFN